MTFRDRLLLTFLLVVLLPMIALALVIRNEMTGRLTAQYERRVESLVAVIEDDLERESNAIAASLAALRKAVAEDNRFRRAAVDRAPEERRYLLDYAGNAMQLAGLSMLQIQDQAGRILSSGHFRNEYDRLEPQLPRLLAAAGGSAVVRARAPDAPFLALVRVDSLQMGGMRFTIVAGSAVEGGLLARLAREEAITVSLVYPGGRLSYGAARGEAGAADTLQPQGAGAVAQPSIVRELTVPFVDLARGELGLATFRVTHELAELEALRSGVDRWFLAAVAAAVILAIVLVSWLASRIGRPLAELAEKTARIDLDRLDVDFDTDRKDEVGVLSRLLGAMTERLRAGAVLVKDAERRATLGELARQVNHDIRNGLTPIRNVVRHLAELSKSEPEKVTEVLRERQHTLDSSISYLDDLATNYARLSRETELRSCDLNAIVARVAADLRGTGQAQIRTRLGHGATVVGDAVSLRRLLENLVTNAVDSLESRPGTVTISTESVAGGDDRPTVRLTVADTGAGMSEEQQAKAFDDFYTTKDDGTGLGLSIVRRLVMDLDGSIRLESKEGEGTRFSVDLPGTGPA